jgi:hypothetical protein
MSEDNAPLPKDDSWLTNCQYRGKMEFARADNSELKEMHPCKNKRIEFVYCETAIKYKLCSEQEVMPS